MTEPIAGLHSEPLLKDKKTPASMNSLPEAPLKLKDQTTMKETMKANLTAPVPTRTTLPPARPRMNTEHDKPQRIQLSRAKGWKMPENTVSVARPGRWGNPYHVEYFGLPLAIKLFRESVKGFWSPSNVEHLSDELAHHAYRCHAKLRLRLQFTNAAELRGKNLACWCKPGEPCHADVLLELANRPL